MKKITLTTLLMSLPLILIACAPQTTPETEAPQTQPEVTSPTEATPQPTATTSAPTDTASPVTEEATEPPSTEEAADPAGISYANDVYPIFEASCIKCHGVESTKEGLDMLTYENLMVGSRNGTVLVPGNAADSLLVQLIVEGEMPNRGPGLTAEQIQIISDWVNQGALNN